MRAHKQQDIEVVGDATATHARRKVLTAAMAGAAAWLAGVARPIAARAADGDPLILGERNTERTTTGLDTRAEGATTLVVAAHGESSVAILGSSGEGSGVRGESNRGAGVSASSSLGNAVEGTSYSGIGVTGNSFLGAGVQGGSSEFAGVQGNSRYGVAVDGGNVSQEQPAVRGWAQAGQTGVFGISSPEGEPVPLPVSPVGVGVFGLSQVSGGTGVVATGDVGVDVRGRALFSSSGTATVRAGTRSVDVATEFTLSKGSRILATLQGSPGNGAVVQAAIPQDERSFRIVLSEPVARDVTIAWFVIG